jgi:hypothetical protein
MEKGYALMEKGYALSEKGYARTEEGYALSEKGYALSEKGYALTEFRERGALGVEVLDDTWDSLRLTWLRRGALPS